MYLDGIVDYVLYFYTTGSTVGSFIPASPQTREQRLTPRLLQQLGPHYVGRNFPAPSESCGTPAMWPVLDRNVLRSVGQYFNSIQQSTCFICLFCLQPAAPAWTVLCKQHPDSYLRAFCHLLPGHPLHPASHFTPLLGFSPFGGITS